MRGVQVELSDMPAWVKAEVATHIKQKRKLVCRIHPIEHEVSIGTTFHDNARQVIIARNAEGETKTIRGGYYDSILNFSKEEMTGHQGGKTMLPIDAQVLRLVIFYKLNDVDLYIRRDGPYMDLLRGLSDGATLTPIQIGILHLYTQLTATGRKMKMRDCHIPRSLVNVVTSELETMGYVKVSRNGAVRKTIEGRRMSDQTNGKGPDWYEWRECHGYVRRGGRVGGTFKGYAGEVIDEYRDRMRAEMKSRGVI